MAKPLSISEMIENGDDISHLLVQTVEVDERDSEGRTPLSYAAKIGASEIVKSLLLRGADVNAVDRHGKSPLWYAADGHSWWDYPEEPLGAAQLLVEAGAQVDAACNQGKTPLLTAAEDTDFELLSYLIDCGADVNVRDDQGNTALMYAAGIHFAYLKETSTLQRLLDAHADIHATNNEGYSALHHAINECVEENVAFLLASGADGSPDLLPALRGCLAVLARDHHALETSSKNENTSWGRTPLIWAAALGYREGVQFLIERGDDINVQDRSGWSALLHAMFKQHREIVEDLLNAGADVTFRGSGEQFGSNSNSFNALRAAVAQGDYELSMRLFNLGASINPLEGGPEPSDVAKLKCVPILRAQYYAGQRWGFVGLAMETGDKDLVDETIDDGIEIATAGGGSDKGVSPALYMAALRGNAEMVRHLLGRGANPNYISQYSDITPAMFATFYGHNEVVGILLEAGAEPPPADIIPRMNRMYAEVRRNWSYYGPINRLMINKSDDKPDD